MGDEDGTPWWSWVVGGAGAVVVVAGIVTSATAATCGANGAPDAACTSGTAIADAGSTIASLGVPLLAVPLTYLARDAVGERAQVIPSVSASSASVSVGGEW
jgi:hypothetical protein